MTKLLVPLYPWIGDQTEIDEAVATLRKGDIAIVTGPDSGVPDASEADELREVVGRLHANGVSVVGYVSTRFGGRPPMLAAEEAIAWRILVGVDGIFWDEINVKASLQIFRSMHGLPRSWRPHKNTWIAGVPPHKQKGLSIWNPGVWDTRIIDLMRRLPESIWNVWEGSADDYRQQAPVTHRFPAREAHIIYDANGVHVETPPSLGYRYVTNDKLPNPFDSFDPVS